MKISDGSLIYSDYLDAFNSKKSSLVFVAGPAGSGKTRVVINQMVGSSYKKTVTGTVFLSLEKIRKDLGSRDSSVWGSQEKLGTVSAIEDSSIENGGIFNLVCLSQFELGRVPDEFKKSSLFHDRTPQLVKDRFMDRCKNRFRKEMESDMGLRLFIDDLDEIEEIHLHKLMDFIDSEISRVPGPPSRKLMIFLGGRPEVFYTATKESKAIWDSSKNRNVEFSLLTGTIEPMDVKNPNFPKYLERCIAHSVSDSTSQGLVLEAIREQINQATNLRESIAYIEGCQIAALHFQTLIKNGQPFVDKDYGTDFYLVWRTRAKGKHGLPSVNDSGDYEKKLQAAAKIIASGGGEVRFDDRLGVLLYSGLVNLTPVEYGKRTYNIKFQFPQFQARLSPPCKATPPEHCIPSEDITNFSP